MKFGTVAPTFPPIDEIPRTAKRLEEKGYHSLWFPDHLMGWYPHELWKESVFGKIFPSCHIFFDAFSAICYASCSTEKIMLGTGVTDVLRRHPAVLLQQAVTANHASKGRFILGVGAGEGENTLPYGISLDKPVSRLEEALELMKLMLEADYGEEINFDGRFFKFRKAVFDLKPLKKIPIWLGAHGERMLRLTAKHADGWLPSSMPLELYSEKVKKLESFCKEYGRDGGEIERALFVSLIIDEKREEVDRILNTPLLKIHSLLMPPEYFEKLGLKHPLGDFYGLLDYVPTNFSKEKIMEILKNLPLKAVKLAFISGTPEEVVQTFDGFANEGVEHFVLWNLTYFGDVTKVKSSYQLIDEVMSHF
ncbi:MAG: LLM class flavin-dependent oxidoreductase [Archaeoglobus sp.]|nr:LLM class flavin-dependent oxidoreductase [Archaeoglobus sp.]